MKSSMFSASTKDEDEDKKQFEEVPELHRVYTKRWAVLITVSLVNVGINILMYSYSTVASDAASYFGKETSDINNFTNIGLIFSFLFSLGATWIVEKLRLRKTVLIAATLSFTGGLLRFLATFPAWNESLHIDVQFIMTMIGQALQGIANPLGFCLPTRVAVDWFPEHEAPLASGLITMAFTFGLAISTGITPIVFSDEDLISWMNVVYFIPACLSFLCAIFILTSDTPPLPPTHSAVVNHDTHMTYMEKIKKLMTNKNFVIIITCSGGLVGLLNGLLSTFTQISCSVGYSNEFSGVCVTIMNFCGVAGGITASFIFRRTGLVEEQAKITYAIGALISMPLLYVLLTPDLDWLLATLCAALGILCFGLLPLSAELILENTYPIDPPTGMSLYFSMSQIGSVIVIGAKGFLEQDFEDDRSGQTCSGAADDFTPTDNSTFAMSMMGLVTVMTFVFIIFLRSQYRRRRLDVTWHKEHDHDFDQISHSDTKSSIKSYDSITTK